MLIDDELEEQDLDERITELKEKNKKVKNAYNQTLMKVLDSLAVAITELAVSGTPTDKSIGQNIAESFEKLAASIEQNVSDINTVVDSNKTISGIVETIKKDSFKTAETMTKVVANMQDQTKFLIKALDDIQKTKPEYQTTINEIVRTINKSNEVILTKLQFPDYSKQLSELAQAIASRPTEFTMYFTRSMNSRLITSARISPTEK
jgi:ABC-type transporter Mla subunit MlaD